MAAAIAIVLKTCLNQGSYKNLEGVGGWKLHESMVGGGGGNGMRER